MITSRLINDILDLLLDGDKFGLALRAQIPVLIDSEYDYTGVGVFVKFTATEGIENCLHDGDSLVLDGVDIRSEELNIGATATLFVKNGIADYLNIWSYDGNYPYKELSTYTVKQTFQEIDKARGFISW